MSSVVLFENVKFINSKYKKIVFQFIRNIEILLPVVDNTYYVIDELIKCTILLFTFSVINSSILSSDEENELLILFKQQNKFIDLGSNYGYYLIYDSETDELNKFYTLCNYKANLLFLIHTENDDVFGGYTSKIFNNSSSNDDKAFIFSIRSSQNFKPAIFNVIIPNHAFKTNSYDDHFLMFGHDPAAFDVYIMHSGHFPPAIYYKTFKSTNDYESYPNAWYLSNSNGIVSKFEVFQIANEPPINYKERIIWDPQLIKERFQACFESLSEDDEQDETEHDDSYLKLWE